MLIVMSNCNKSKKDFTANTNNNDYTELIEKSKAMQEHILAFKTKMEYYRDNPGIKSGGELYTADSAVIELESLLNFNFCYTNIECNQKTFEISEVTMPLDEIGKINKPDLMLVYYDKVIDTVQAQMGRVNYTNMKLLIVDLKVIGTNSNGDAIISVGALIGNEKTVILNDGSWWYGHLLGTCSGTSAGTDAAKQLESRVTNAMTDLPPTGCHFYFPNPQPILFNPLSYQLDPTPNNFEDYKIYYAIDNVGNGLTDDVKCLSRDEMSFYENHYVDLALEQETLLGMKFDYCEINHGDYYDNNGIMYIQHDYVLYVGVRFLECNYVIDDILEY